MFGIPDKYFWPGLVMALLFSSTGFWIGMYFVAKSDGGPQVVENYYQRAAHYDDIRAERQAARDTGWKVDVDLQDRTKDGLEVSVADASGQPVAGLEGNLALYRPDLAGAQAKAGLKPIDGHPGRYRAQVNPDRPGLWDFVIEANRDGKKLRFELREEVSLREDGAVGKEVSL